MEEAPVLVSEATSAGSVVGIGAAGGFGRDDCGRFGVGGLAPQPYVFCWADAWGSQNHRDKLQYTDLEEKQRTRN